MAEQLGANVAAPPRGAELLKIVRQCQLLYGSKDQLVQVYSIVNLSCFVLVRRYSINHDLCSALVISPRVQHCEIEASTRHLVLHPLPLSVGNPRLCSAGMGGI